MHPNNIIITRWSLRFFFFFFIGYIIARREWCYIYIVLHMIIHIISAQTTCNQGIGRIVYERLPDQQLQGFDDDVVSTNPFKHSERARDGNNFRERPRTAKIPTGSHGPPCRVF